MPGCGKTTIGKVLAESLSWSFIDTDRLIEKAYGKSCREIYLEKGESYFRKIENEQIASLGGLQHYVIALGGGAKLPTELGSIIYLKAPIDMLWGRIQGKPAYLNPKDPKKSFFKLANQRIPIYETFSNFQVDTEFFSLETIVDAIKEKIYGK